MFSASPGVIGQGRDFPLKRTIRRRHHQTRGVNVIDTPSDVTIATLKSTIPAYGSTAVRSASSDALPMPFGVKPLVLVNCLAGSRPFYVNSYLILLPIFFSVKVHHPFSSMSPPSMFSALLQKSSALICSPCCFKLPHPHGYDGVFMGGRNNFRRIHTEPQTSSSLKQA